MASGHSLFVGLDIGGTFLKGAQIDSSGEVVGRLKEPVAKDSAETILQQIGSVVSDFVEDDPSVQAVGIGLPGIVDRGSLRVRASPNVPALNGLDLGMEVAQRAGRPTFIENDANAAALGEGWIGAGRGVRSVLYVTLGTGIGAGLLLDGRIWAGRSGYAGEIGHVQVEPAGVRCGCGSWGCLETVAGIPGWERRANALLGSRESTLAGGPLDPAAIVAAARGGDAVALEVVDGAARALGVGIAAALNLLNLERVVIGGGVAAAGAFLLDRIERETRSRTYPQVMSDCSFRLGELTGDAGVIGAARVAMVEMEARAKA